jgi:FKBP-type peptidyl-prolyl cis-trans isomerase FklB
MNFKRAGLYLIALFFVALSVNGNAKDTKFELKTQQDSIAYTIGANWGLMLKGDSLMFNPEIIKQGINDALFVGKTKLTEDQLKEVMTAFQNQLKEKQMKMQQIKADANKKKGDAFLAENKTKEGVKTTPSGLQYKVVTEGHGKTPTKESTVKVHYTGTLIDGTKFDSSRDRNQPAEFGVGQVIKGWTEALQLMKEGDRWMLYIPSDLAYGPRAASEVIGPNEVLIFDVELLNVVDKQPEATPKTK